MKSSALGRLNIEFFIGGCAADARLAVLPAEWESKQDFYEHIKSKAVEPLAEYIKENVRAASIQS